jgi:hypothetical protein
VSGNGSARVDNPLGPMHTGSGNITVGTQLQDSTSPLSGVSPTTNSAWLRCVLLLSQYAAEHRWLTIAVGCGSPSGTFLIRP